MQFTYTKEDADRLAATLTSTKDAVAIVKGVFPESEIVKNGRDQLYLVYRGEEVFFHKKTVPVAFKGRGGEAFRQRSVGFDQVEIKAKGQKRRIDKDADIVDKLRAKHAQMAKELAARRLADGEGK